MLLTKEELLDWFISIKAEEDFYIPFVEEFFEKQKELEKSLKNNLVVSTSDCIFALQNNTNTQKTKLCKQQQVFSKQI